MKAHHLTTKTNTAESKLLDATASPGGPARIDIPAYQRKAQAAPGDQSWKATAQPASQPAPAPSNANVDQQEYSNNVPLIHQFNQLQSMKNRGVAPDSSTASGSVDDRLLGGSAADASTTAGDGQVGQATNSILPQIARMTGPGYADDLMTIIDTAMSVLQRSAPTAYREKMAQFRGQSTGQQREKPQDIVNRNKPLGPSKVVANNPGAPTDAEREKFDQRVAQATGTMGESRKRTYGGKYIKESADQKLAREFENFLLNQE